MLTSPKRLKMNAGNKPLLLCVDDEKPALTLRKMVLEQNGYNVLTAIDCHAALDIVQKNAVSMVISDHMLGAESGIDLAADIKRLDPHIPIVILAGFPPDSMANVDCFILKGEDPRKILRILRDMLSQ
jgi:two-component system C4-dicarboxylate transport response regulator DctD